MIADILQVGGVMKLRRREKRTVVMIPSQRQDLDELHRKFDEAVLTVAEAAEMDRLLQVEMGLIRREIQLARKVIT